MPARTSRSKRRLGGFELLFHWARMQRKLRRKAQRQFHTDGAPSLPSARDPAAFADCTASIDLGISKRDFRPFPISSTQRVSPKSRPASFDCASSVTPPHYI